MTLETPSDRESHGPGRPPIEVDLAEVRRCGVTGLSGRDSAKALGMSETTFRRHMEIYPDFRQAFEAGRKEFEAGLPPKLKNDPPRTFLYLILQKHGIPLNDAVDVVNNLYHYQRDKLIEWFTWGNRVGPHLFAPSLHDWLQKKDAIPLNCFMQPTITSGMLLTLCFDPQKYGLPFPNGAGVKSRTKAKFQVEITINSIRKVRTVEGPADWSEEQARAAAFPEFVEAK